MPGKRLKRLREKLRLTQKEFAEKLGYSQAYIAELEKGKKEPSRKFLQQLKSQYAINIEWILFGEGPMFREEERNLQERIQELEAELKKMEEAKEEGEDTRVPGEGLLARLQAKIRQLEAENRYLKGMVAAYKDALKHLNKAPNSG